MEKTYRIIRSDRKTMALECMPDGELVVRAPRYVPGFLVDVFVKDHEEWIRKHQETARTRREAAPMQPKLSAEEVEELAARAREVIPERVRYYAPLAGVTYGRITIRKQRTRWGSCSSAGNLNFNCLLMLAPPEVLDSVVVHELCHRKEMDHSKRFYEEVYRVLPGYGRWNRWLKKHGRELLDRLP